VAGANVSGLARTLAMTRALMASNDLSALGSGLGARLFSLTRRGWFCFELALDA
jgi:hypothetical protein